MILAALKGLAALPRLIDAVESLGDIATAQLAQERKDEKDEMVDDIIAAARHRREQRVLEREAERVSGDSGETPEGA
tara:strand:+ start:2586 stop:2816 length:231 start_codon:yes stop_codon:yes gene_type:complete